MGGFLEGILDLNNINESKEDDILNQRVDDSDINECTFIDTLTEAIVEATSAVFASDESSDDAITEATKLAKNNNNLKKKKKEFTSKIKDLKKKQKDAEKGSKEYDSYTKKIDKIQSQIDNLNESVQKKCDDESCRKCRKAEDLKKLNENVEIITESFNQILTEDVNIPVPGGLNEKPKGVPADHNVKTPSKTEITSDQYNKAITNLQRTFREAAEAMDILANAVIVNESVDTQQEKYMESVIDNAIMESFDNGPIYEAVDRSDKDAIKKIVGSIRKSIKSTLKDHDITYYEPNMVARTIAGALAGATVGIASGGISAPTAIVGTAAGATAATWRTRLWQIVGICHIEAGNVSTLAKHLNEHYKDELGDYKILPVKAQATLHDAFKTKFNWKNNKGSYFLLVDKKIPAEIKQLQSEISKAIESTDTKDEKEVKESTEFDEYVDLIEESFVEFVESIDYFEAYYFEGKDKKNAKALSNILKTVGYLNTVDQVGEKASKNYKLSKEGKDELKKTAKKIVKFLPTLYKNYEIACNHQQKPAMSKKEFVSSMSHEPLATLRNIEKALGGEAADQLREMLADHIGE